MLNLEENQFYGPLPFKFLPASMVFLSLAKNYWTEHVGLNSLPKSLKLLCLNRNPGIRVEVRDFKVSKFENMRSLTYFGLLIPGFVIFF